MFRLEEKFKMWIYVKKVAWLLLVSSLLVMAHAYGGIGLCRTLSLPPLRRSVPLPHLRGSLPLPPRKHFLSFPLFSHFNGKSLDDVIASIPTGIDSSDWQTMCEMWTTGDEWSHMHGRTPHRLEVFKMGRCKDLHDDSESWVDEESRRRYEAMTQMIAPSSYIDAESHTPATPEDAFISVMGKDRPGCVRCAGSGETLGTWYRSTGTFASSERERIMQ
ncbi:hypothetical protein Taro_004162 [Colocasia esculenta]|uniref:Uncharacterized protein n=1 Tax=Colocasia esculenta TaxID=4460 RepID=A0A843THG9_COLES|nr:hypothetical protein [Colocasia esculenta]